MNRLKIVTIIAILIGVGLRLWMLGQMPSGLYWDEQAILLDARQIALAGHDWQHSGWWQPIYISYGDYKAAPYIWLVSLIGQIIGFSSVAVRLPNLIFGILQIPLLGVLGWQIEKMLTGNKKLKITTSSLMWWSMLVLALAPWSIHFSRVGFESFAAQFWLTLSIVLLLVSTKWSLAAAGFFGGITMLSYFSARYVWIPAYLSFSYLQARTLLSKRIIPWIIGLVLAALMLCWLIFWPSYQTSQSFRLSTSSVLNCCDYALNSNILRQQSGNTLASRIFFHRHVLKAKQVAINVAQNLEIDFIFFQGDGNYRHSSSQTGLFLWPFIPLFIVGLLYVVRRFKQLWPILIWWGAALIPASLPMEVPHAQRLLTALSPMSMLIALGGYILWKKWKNHNFAWIVWMLFVSFALINFAWFYYNLYPKLSHQAWQGGYQLAAKRVVSQAEKGQSVYVEPFDDRFFLWVLTEYPASMIESANFDGLLILKTWQSVNFDYPKDSNLPTGEFWLIGRSTQIEDWLSRRPKLKILTKEYFSDTQEASNWVEYKISL